MARKRPGLRSVSPGGLVQPGDRITTLDDIDRIKVDFSVPERFLASLVPGQLIQTQSAAYPGRSFEGRLSAAWRDERRREAETNGEPLPPAADLLAHITPAELRIDELVAWSMPPVSALLAAGIYIEVE